MAAGDVYECSAEMTHNQQQIVMGFHFVQIGADGSGDPRQAVANVWLGNFETPLLACLSSQVQINVLRIRRVLPTQTQSLVATVGTLGTVIGVTLPTNQCAVLRLYGVLAARKGVGNVRMPGIGATFIDEGQVNASYVGLTELFGDAFEVDQTDIPTAFTFRSCVLGTDDVPRQVQRALMTSRVKQLRSRTIGQGQ